MSKLYYSEMKFFTVDSVANKRSLKSVKVSYSVPWPRSRIGQGGARPVTKTQFLSVILHKKEKTVNFCHFAPIKTKL